MSIQPCRNDVQGGDCHGELSPLLGGKRAAPATLLHSPAIRSRRCRAGGMSDCDSLGRPLRSAFLRQGSRRGREDAARPCTALRGVPARPRGRRTMGRGMYKLAHRKVGSMRALRWESAALSGRVPAPSSWAREPLCAYVQAASVRSATPWLLRTDVCLLTLRQSCDEDYITRHSGNAELASRSELTGN